MSGWLAAPILIPLAAAALLVLVRGRRWRGILALAGAAAHCGSGLVLVAACAGGGHLVLAVGGWPAPYGIALVADLFAAIMVAVTGLLGLLVGVYALGTDDLMADAVFPPLAQVLLMGAGGAFLAGDLFNLYVWFEVLLIASFVLLTVGRRPAQLAGAVKYVAINFLASAMFLTACGLLYGKTGTLNLADLARKIPADPATGVVLTSASLLLAAFGIKAALFPFFNWLPAAYPTPPVAVSALFAGVLTKVGVYALIRLFTLVFVQDVGRTHALILVLSVATMITGVLGAAAQGGLRRILAVHIVSQIGYMTLGLGVWTPAALAAVMVYMVHNMVVKTNLFLVVGAVKRLRGTEELARLGGLWREHPGLSGLFLVSALSLAGLPPLSGFVAKFVVIRACFLAGHWLAGAVALGVGLLTLFSMVKIWLEAFWKESPDGAAAGAGPAVRPLGAPVWVPVLVLTAITVAVGLYPEPLLELAQRAGDQLMDRAGYIRAVLGE